MLLDFGSIVVHVMTPEAKAHYRLEELWTTDEFERLRSQVEVEDAEVENAELENAEGTTGI